MMTCNSTTFISATASDWGNEPTFKNERDIDLIEVLAALREAWLEGVRLCARAHDHAVAVLPLVIRARFNRRSAPRWKQGRFKSKT